VSSNSLLRPCHATSAELGCELNSDSTIPMVDVTIEGARVRFVAEAWDKLRASQASSKFPVAHAR